MSVCLWSKGFTSSLHRRGQLRRTQFISFLKNGKVQLWPWCDKLQAFLSHNSSHTERIMQQVQSETVPMHTRNVASWCILVLVGPSQVIPSCKDWMQLRCHADGKATVMLPWHSSTVQRFGCWIRSVPKESFLCSDSHIKNLLLLPLLAMLFRLIFEALQP